MFGGNLILSSSVDASNYSGNLGANAEGNTITVDFDGFELGTDGDVTAYTAFFLGSTSGAGTINIASSIDAGNRIIDLIPQGGVTINTANNGLTGAGFRIFGGGSGGTVNLGSSIISLNGAGAGSPALTGITINSNNNAIALNGSSSTIYIDNTSGSNLNLNYTHTGTSITGRLGDIVITQDSAGGSLTFLNSSYNITIGDLTLDYSLQSGLDFEITLTSGKRVSGGTFTLIGNPTNNVSINASTEDAEAEIDFSQSSVRYVTATDINSVSQTIYDIPGGVDGGGNTNWIFPGASSNPSGTLPTYNPSLVSAVKFVLQDTGLPQVVMAGLGGANEDEYELFKKTDEEGLGYDLCIWRSKIYQIGNKFDVKRISFPILPSIASNMEIVPALHFDNDSSVSFGNPINTATYASGTERIVLYPPNFSNAVRGNFNFFLELRFTGLALSVVGLPIDIDIETIET